MDHTRHIGIFNAGGWQVAIIGAGGIGAITALVLAKMGLDLTIIDDDTVDEVNLATQFHYMNSVGRPKIHALTDLLYEMTDVSCTSFVDRVTEENAALYRAPIIISAVDSINARKAIWAGLKDQRWLWYIDARMGAEAFSRYVVDGTDRQWYDNVLASHDEDAVPDLPCTSKATIYCGAVAAGLLGSDVRKIITGEVPPKMLAFDLPSNWLFVS